MKKKIFVFCLVFVFFGAGFVFSQNARIVESVKYRCGSSSVDGSNHLTSIISNVVFYLYSNDTVQFVISYNNGIPTESITFINPRYNGERWVYNVYMQIRGNTHGITGSFWQGSNDCSLNFISPNWDNVTLRLVR